MQSAQKKYGRDKFEVVLLSIDVGYGDTYDSAKASVKRTMSRHGVNWPSIVDPQGWDGVMRKFNVGGYKPILVDTRGIVRGVDVRGKELDGLLAEILKK